VPLSVGFLADESESYGVSLDTHLNRWRVDRVRLKDTNEVEPLTGTLNPPNGARCTPKAAAWSLKLDALAIAYSCGQIVFEPTGPSFVAMDNHNTLGSEQALGDTADDRCEPTKMALNGGESRLVVA
jgi:hypothetical protein